MSSTASPTHSRRVTSRLRRRRAGSCSRPSSALHARAESPDRAAFSATVHCLTGCGVGEVVGMVISTIAGWGNLASIVVSVALGFLFGYSLTLRPVLAAGVGLRRAAGIALAAD